MVIRNDPTKALAQLDDAVEQWHDTDAELIDAMAYALACNASRNEVARRVNVFSRPTVLSVLGLIDRKDAVTEILARAGVPAVTADDTEPVWLRIVSKPRRGLTIEHDPDALARAGGPGTHEREVAAKDVAGTVVGALYDAGFTMVAGKTRLTRAAAAEAFADPGAVLWIEQNPKP
ncbi:hypothetical protein [Nocardia fluminea]|uniref:hypothetical protein n=1 Tax=Nocardia fluminea TaxID=134984 RepID=UPI003D0E8806